MTRLISPLVGVHFHPPAKALLAYLAAGTPLALRAEPENPYDADAIRVELEPEALVERAGSLTPELKAGLFEALMGQGITLEQLASAGPIVLGHIAASGGKPLAKLRKAQPGLGVSGTIEWKEALEAQADGSPGWKCELAFALDGSPLASASWEEAD